MREVLTMHCESFFKNREQVSESFKWQNDSLVSVCAAMMTGNKRRVDTFRLKECKEMLKAQTSVFSNFRGNAEMSIVTMMALSDNPAQKLTNTLKCFEALKQQFWATEYLVLAASVLSETVTTEQSTEMAARAKGIYKLMKEQHPFLTSNEDCVSAVMLAASDKLNDELLIMEAEKIYQNLKQIFSSSNDVQSVSFVLALADGNADEKSRKFVNLYNALKMAGVKYGKYYELTTLAALSILPVEVDILVRDIIFADQCLAEKKPYSGLFGLPKQTRLMHAAMLVNSAYSESEEANIAAMTSTLAMIAAQQAALCATICATTAATAASASH